jgi:hypothetical protein
VGQEPPGELPGREVVLVVAVGGVEERHRRLRPAPALVGVAAVAGDRLHQAVHGEGVAAGLEQGEAAGGEVIGGEHRDRALRIAGRTVHLGHEVATGPEVEDLDHGGATLALGYGI